MESEVGCSEHGHRRTTEQLSNYFLSFTQQHKTYKNRQHTLVVYYFSTFSDISSIKDLSPPLWIIAVKTLWEEDAFLSSSETWSRSRTMPPPDGYSVCAHVLRMRGRIFFSAPGVVSLCHCAAYRIGMF